MLKHLRVARWGLELSESALLGSVRDDHGDVQELDSARSGGRLLSARTEETRRNCAQTLRGRSDGSADRRLTKAQKLRFIPWGGHFNNQKKKKKEKTERLKITQENHALFMPMERWHACSSSLDLFPSHTGSQEHPCAYSPFSCPICAIARSSPPIPSCKSLVIRRPAASAPRPMEPPTGASRSPCRASCRRAASRHLG